MIRTSKSHPLKIAEKNTGNGVIGITFCPGKKQKESISGCEWDRDLIMDINNIRNWDANIVFGFPEQHEFDSLSVSKIHSSFNDLGIQFIHIPFVDDTIPDKNTENIILQWIPIIEDKIREGKKVLFFCKGGLGRSGLVFAIIDSLISGEPPHIAIKKLRNIRPGAICTPEQYNYVINFVNSYSKHHP